MNLLLQSAIKEYLLVFTITIKKGVVILRKWRKNPEMF